MVRLQAINRDDQVKSLDLRPLGWDGANCAGYKLDFDPHLTQSRQQNVQLSEPYQRLAAHDRKVERAMAPHQRQHAVNQFLSLIIGHRAQGPQLSEMFGLVSVTPRAAQRALTGDLDRQHRMMAAQNAAPTANYVSFFHASLSSGGSRNRPPRGLYFPVPHFPVSGFANRKMWDGKISSHHCPSRG